MKNKLTNEIGTLFELMDKAVVNYMYANPFINLKKIKIRMNNHTYQKLSSEIVKYCNIEYLDTLEELKYK